MKKHNTIPSFASNKIECKTKELSWDGEKYVLSLHDEKSVLSKFNFTSSDANVKLNIVGTGEYKSYYEEICNSYRW